MNRTIVGALLIVVITVIGAFGVKLMLPLFEDFRQKETTDADKTKGKIRVALDNWVGYFVLNSPEMKEAMRRSGYVLVCEDDDADYAARMKRLKNGEIDFAVATVDSFILNAADLNYPGAIVMVIDESKGGDAILAVKSKVAGLDGIKGRSDIRVAFTPNSPSHHLLKAAAEHFSAPELLPSSSLRIETEGSQKAMEKLLSGQADVAVCWEPDVSRALSDDNIVKILGTEDTERLIVDILVAGRKTIAKNPETISVLLGNYFRVLKKYRSDPDLLKKHVEKHTGLSEEKVESMLKGVHWVNFNENCENWFGVSAPGRYANEGLADAILAAAKILQGAGDFSKSPVPGDDPYRLTNSNFLEEIFSKGAAGFPTPTETPLTAGSVGSLEARFSSLSEEQWNALKEVGTLKIDPIVFQQGASELDLIAKKVIDQAVERLKHYPNFRVVIKGHTDSRGDSDENMRLSSERADSAARYLQVAYNVDPNRLRVVGLGGTQPLAMRPGESRRAWMYRLPRVELVLAREDF